MGQASDSMMIPSYLAPRDLHCRAAYCESSILIHHGGYHDLCISNLSKAILLWWIILFYVLVLIFVLLAPYILYVFIFLVKFG